MFYHGLQNSIMHVTQLVNQNCRHNNLVYIPAGPKRDKVMNNNTIPDTEVYIHDTENNIVLTYSYNEDILVDFDENKIYTHFYLDEETKNLFPIHNM